MQNLQITDEQFLTLCESQLLLCEEGINECLETITKQNKFKHDDFLKLFQSSIYFNITNHYCSIMMEFDKELNRRKLTESFYLRHPMIDYVDATLNIYPDYLTRYNHLLEMCSLGYFTEENLIRINYLLHEELEKQLKWEKESASKPIPSSCNEYDA